MIIATEGEHRNRVPKLWLPEGLDLQGIVGSKLADQSGYVVSTLVRKHTFRDLDERGFATLNMQILHGVLTHNHCKGLIDGLERAGVIEIDRHYVPGEKSRGYRLGKEWLSRRCRFQAITDQRLLYRIGRERDRMEIDQKAKWLPIHHRLNRLQRTLTLASGIEEALDGLEADCRLSQSAIIGNIQNRTLPFSVSQWGRVFNAITGVKRTLRPYLLMEGQPLAGYDISCCQPALLAYLIRVLQPVTKENHIRYPLPSGGLLPSCSLSSCVLCPLPSLPSGLPVVAADELVSFSSLTEDGSLYGYLLKALGWSGSEKGLLKEKFLMDVLAKRRVSKRGKPCDYESVVENAFVAEFPGVHAWVKAVNREYHGTLIRILQRLEAWLVIEHIAPLCPPCVTLHDGIYCPARSLPAVQEAIERGFQVTGFRAGYKPC